jgi:hypothetical protein
MNQAPDPTSEPPAPAAAPTRSVRRRRHALSIADLLPDVGRKAFRGFGFVESAVLQRWAEIVGPDYAAWTVPVKLSFPPGQRRGATLTLIVDGPIGLRLKHVEPVVLDRINMHFGYAAVARLALRQGPLPRPEVRPKPAPPVLSAQQQAALSHTLAPVQDPDLRAVLERIGREVLGEAKPKL